MPMLCVLFTSSLKPRILMFFLVFIPPTPPFFSPCSNVNTQFA